MLALRPRAPSHCAFDSWRRNRRSSPRVARPCTTCRRATVRTEAGLARHPAGDAASWGGGRPTYLDLALADHVAHFAVAAVQGLAGLEAHAIAAFADID